MEEKELTTQTVEVLNLDAKQLKECSDEDYQMVVKGDIFNHKEVEVSVIPELEVVTLPDGSHAVVDEKIIEYIEHNGDLSCLAPEGTKLEVVKEERNEGAGW